MCAASDPIDTWRPPWRSFADFLAERDADAPYLTELDPDGIPGREWSGAGWREEVRQAGTALAARGLRPGDTVAALAGNSADALAVAFACWSGGLCYLPLNAHEPADRQAFILADAGARLLVHTMALEADARALADTAGIGLLGTDELAQHRPGNGGTDGATLPALDSLDVPALQVYTSGTTGEPKGVELTVANLLTDCDALHRRLGWDADTRVLVVLPIHHVNGLVVSSLLSWYAGSSAVLADRFRSDRFWPIVAERGATVCSMVPSLLEFLLAEPVGAVPDGFGEVLCGAGPLMCETVTAFEAAFGVPVRHLYGLSESTAVTTMMPDLPGEERRRWYTDTGFPSVGPALEHVQVAVHDADGRELPAGERGEIVIRGGTVMTGYAGRPDATGKALANGWFHSGDEGFWQPDAEGTAYFFVSGRIKELIVRGGVNISPFLVDEVLHAHPKVQFGLAVPFENRYYGEEIAAYVVPREPVTEQEVLDFCAARLDFAYRPKVVVLGDEVPFTATGKAKRLSLRQQLGDELAAYRDVQFRRSSAADMQKGSSDEQER
jgi:long-chain acyl-CoA synthetase